MGTCWQQEIPSWILHIPPLTHITAQLIYNTIQNYLSPRKHNYLIYYLRTFLLILKFGYPALNIVRNSSPSFCALKLSVTPLSSQSLMIYGLPIIILEHSIVTTKNITNGYIDSILLITLALGHATNIKQTNQHASPGQPLWSYNISSCPKHSRKPPETKNSQFRISNRILHIKMKGITLDVMNLTSHGRDHAECALYRHILNLLLFFYHCGIYLCANLPGSCFALSRNCKVSIHMKFHDYK